MSERIDIKDVLENISKKNYGWFDQLPYHLQESFDPFIVMQFLSSATNDSEYYVEAVNKYINVGFNQLSKNKSAFYRACCAISLGKPIRTKFIRPPKGKRNNDSLITRFVSDYHEDSIDDAVAVRFIERNRVDLDDDDFIGIAEAMDWSNSDIDKLAKELKQL